MSTTTYIIYFLNLNFPEPKNRFHSMAGVIASLMNNLAESKYIKAEGLILVLEFLGCLKGSDRAWRLT